MSLNSIFQYFEAESMKNWQKINEVMIFSPNLLWFFLILICGPRIRNLLTVQKCLISLNTMYFRYFTINCTCFFSDNNFSILFFVASWFFGNIWWEYKLEIKFAMAVKGSIFFTVDCTSISVEVLFFFCSSILVAWFK